VYHSLRIRFKNLKDLELVKKAAKAEHRSVNQYMALAIVEAAKATLAMKNPNPSVFVPRG
jgi:uncharacterized protein (DUF1778 family)